MSVSKSLGHIGNERGRENEDRVIVACQTGLPDWVTGVRKATPYEDSRGIDIVFDTDIGKLFVQVKSSKRSAKNFSRANIEAIVCTHNDTDQAIRSKIIQALYKLRNQVLAKRSE